MQKHVIILGRPGVIITRTPTNVDMPTNTLNRVCGGPDSCAVLHANCKVGGARFLARIIVCTKESGGGARFLARIIVCTKEKKKKEQIRMIQCSFVSLFGRALVSFGFTGFG